MFDLIKVRMKRTGKYWDESSSEKIIKTLENESEAKNELSKLGKVVDTWDTLEKSDGELEVVYIYDNIKKDSLNQMVVLSKTNTNPRF